MDPRKPVKVVVVDDHALLHEAVRSLIAQRNDMVLIAAEASAVCGLHVIRETKPDVVVTEARLPDMDGLVLADRILEEHPATKVVVLTMHEVDGRALQALNAGVKAYVSKRSRVSRLLQAIMAATESRMYIDPTVAQKLLGPVSSSSSSLTHREADVVRRVALGYAAEEVADQIGISAKSVQTSRARAYQKLGLKTRAELFRYATEQGWLRQPELPANPPTGEQRRE